MLSAPPLATLLDSLVLVKTNDRSKATCTTKRLKLDWRVLGNLSSVLATYCVAQVLTNLFTERKVLGSNTVRGWKYVRIFYSIFNYVE